MPDAGPTGVSAANGHLSIGEVLALLLEEFPDVTISKIRFLESQGLIDPERTASGYRKFYDDDVELLRCILREQRENYLPLRVIKHRIDSGEIDPTNEHPRPRGIKNVGDQQTTPQPSAHPSAGGVGRRSDAGAHSDSGAAVTGSAVLFQRTDGEAPGSHTPMAEAVAAPVPDTVGTVEPQRHRAPASTPAPAPAPAPAPIVTGAVLPGVQLTADELCAMAGLSRPQLDDLRSFGVVTAMSDRSDGPFDEYAVEIASISRLLLDAGLEARHLRGWRVAADREAGLLEQLIQPLLRQRNPEARAQAVGQLNELEVVGGRLRSAMMRSVLHQH